MTGIDTGLFIAVAGYFVANRVVPLDVPERASLEVKVFLWVWLGSLIAVCLRPVHTAWVEQLSLAALAFLSVPFIDLFQDAGRMTRAFEQGNWSYVSIAVIFVMLAIAFASLAIWLRQGSEKSQKHRAQTFNLGGFK